MTSEEQDQVLVTARFLEAAEKILWLNFGLTIMAAAGLVLRNGSVPAGIAAIILGVFGSVYDVRIAFDARLFRDVALGRIATEDLDRALLRLQMLPAEKSGRSWNDRCRGARRLVFVAGAVAIGQAIAFLLMWR